ncbi:MAG: hypothetical protein ACE5JB_05530 [bacterium]
MVKSQAENEGDKIKWYHRIELRPGIKSQRAAEFAHCPPDEPFGAKHYRLDEIDFKGKSVLDIGAWDGYFSFAAEERGAQKIVATNLKHLLEVDLTVETVEPFKKFAMNYFKDWVSQEAHGDNPERSFERFFSTGLQTAIKARNSKVKEKIINVYDLSPERIGYFDIVLFLGILYHLKSPLFALEHASAVCKETLLLETGTCHQEDLLYSEVPIMVFQRLDRPYGLEDAWGEYRDYTCWFWPNIKCIELMLYSCGFQEVQQISLISNRATFRAQRSPSN